MPLPSQIVIVVAIAEPHMAPSQTSKMDHDRHLDDSTWRTSTTYFINSYRHPKIREIDLRVANLTKTPFDHQEDVQVLRYERSEFYAPHHDYFNIANYQHDQQVLYETSNGKYNRFATVLWYLSDVEEVTSIVTFPTRQSVCMDA